MQQRLWPVAPSSEIVGLDPERRSARRTLSVVPRADAHTQPAELWVGIHLPDLPLEALRPGSPNPLAAIELQGQTQYVIACNARAKRSGVHAGMSLSAALSLVPQLETKLRDSRREQQFLEQVALRAQRFSPRVSCAEPDGIVLEVKGSLHLFGGAGKLREAVESECRELGAQAVVALTPTPLASLAAARAGEALLVLESAQLISQLAPLPLQVLRWPTEALDRLARAGVRTIGDALRLPRAGFARRFGSDLLNTLDRMTGRGADPRVTFKARERFRRRRELLYEIEQCALILEVLEPLLLDLENFLRARQCGITELECLLRHPRAEPTRCMLKLAAPAADRNHFSKLLAERLATMTLAEPVRACELRSGPLLPAAHSTDSLWHAGEHGGQVNRSETLALVEHLRARLGAEAVYGMQVLREHRPERAWRSAEPGSIQPIQPPWPASRRPLWLLPAPEPLVVRNGRPCRGGPLRLTGDVERIETGWWDGADIARDYYTAVDVHGVRLWIFQERTTPGRWFLHGVFG